MSQVPLFANLSEYNLSPQTPTTRAGEENSSDDVVSVESLLDREHTHTLPFENQVFIVTPFLQNKEPVYASIGEEALSDIRSASVVKKYYVEVSAEGFKIHYVVTMVTDLQYFQAHLDFDFLNKPNYSCAEFLSTVSGKLVKSSMYFDGLTVDARVLTEEEILSKDGEGVFFVNLFKTEPATRSRTFSFTIDLSVGLKPYGYDEWLEEQLGEDYIEIEDYIDDPAICTAEYIPPSR